MCEPNRSGHSFDRIWTSTAEDPSLGPASRSESLTHEDATFLDSTLGRPLSAQSSLPCPGLQSGALRSGDEALFGMTLESETEGEVFLGLDSGIESLSEANFDLNYDFDHRSQFLPFTDSPRPTPASYSTPSEATNNSTLGCGPNQSEILLSSPSHPSTPNSSLSNDSSLGSRSTNKAAFNPSHLAEAPGPTHLALPAAQTLPCSFCPRTFASKAQLV